MKRPDVVPDAVGDPHRPIEGLGVFGGREVNTAQKEIEMTTKKNYGPWIKWHGGECPEPPDTLVKVRLRNGTVGPIRAAGTYMWNHIGGCGDIMEYCVAFEQSELEAAEQLLRASGYTVTKPLTFEDVEPMTEVPPVGMRCWGVSPTCEDGAYEFVWSGSESEQRVLKRRMAYLDKEHALIAARHIFGLKGGEL